MVLRAAAWASVARSKRCLNAERFSDGKGPVEEIAVWGEECDLDPVLGKRSQRDHRLEGGDTAPCDQDAHTSVLTTGHVVIVAGERAGRIGVNCASVSVLSRGSLSRSTRNAVVAAGSARLRVS